MIIIETNSRYHTRIPVVHDHASNHHDPRASGFQIPTTEFNKWGVGLSQRTTILGGNSVNMAILIIFRNDISRPFLSRCCMNEFESICIHSSELFRVCGDPVVSPLALGVDNPLAVAWHDATDQISNQMNNRSIVFTEFPKWLGIWTVLGITRLSFHSLIWNLGNPY